MNSLDKFGNFIVENIRDKAIRQYDMLVEGRLKGRRIQDLQNAVSLLPEEQKNLFKDILVDALDTALHDFLFAVQDAHDRCLGIDIVVDGENVAEKSGMLQGEQIGKEGWIERFSKYV